MRVLLFLALFCTLISLCVAVPVKYTLCNDGTPLINITSVDANEWPPKKGTTLNVTIHGILSKEISKGQYTEAVKWSGFPLPPTTGDIGEIKALPWAAGDIEFDISTVIENSDPSGSYNVKISAVDQDKVQIFCVDMAFSLLMNTRGGISNLEMQQQSSEDQTATNPTKPFLKRHSHIITK